MGCCPSKHKDTKGAAVAKHDEYPATEKVDVDFTLSSERPTTVPTPEADAMSARATAYEAPGDMLMDRGDGRAVEYSDHASNNECVVEANQTDHEMISSVRPAEKTEHGQQDWNGPSTTTKPQHQSSSTAASPARPSVSPPSSPFKPAVNFDDIPINSMYHRIHVVEMEEQEAKRLHEQQQEAERREREIQEFKAAMLAATMANEA